MRPPSRFQETQDLFSKSLLSMYQQLVLNFTKNQYQNQFEIKRVLLTVAQRSSQHSCIRTSLDSHGISAIEP